MKTVITFTRTVTLAALLLVFAGASANQSDGDKDTSKCKRLCCRKTESEKEAEQTLKAFNETMREIAVQVKNMDAGQMKVELTQAFAQVPVKVMRTNNGFVVSYATRTWNNCDGGKQKIDFNHLDKEMDKAQEDMTEMDPSLRKDDRKSRKAAEELLKTGIKS
jgi:hypothetical protein